MRIAFDAIGILGPSSKNRGIGNYSTGQFAAMVEQDTNNEYFFFNLFEENFSFKRSIGGGENLEEFTLYSGKDNFLLKDLDNDIIGKIVRKFLRENNIDIFYFTSPFDANMRYQVEWFKDVKMVVLVYDVIPYIYREHYLSDENALKWYMECIEFIRSADQIQVISQSVKDDLIQYLQFPSNKINVIWGAVDKRYHELQVPTKDRQKLLNKFGIDDKFVMCTGGNDERKNIAGLIEAYSKISISVRKEYQLVIVCKLSLEDINKYEKLCKNLGCRGQVVLTNFVTNEELLLLYNLASLMAFPSLYEGFGLPIVEAWACGTPVLTSNNSSLVQIAGEGAILVDPHDIDDIAKGLEFALTECNLDDVLRKGQERLKQFQWERVAELSIVSINSLGMKQQKTALAKNRVKKNLALFVPKEILQKKCQEWDVRIIFELSNYYDVDIFVDDVEGVNIDLGEHIFIFNHKEYKKRFEKYWDTIYQVENTEACLYMFPYIWDNPGTVVLNQYNLYDLARRLCFTKDKQDYDKFAILLEKDYSQQVVDKYISNLKKKKCEHLSHCLRVNGFVANYAKKIIVYDGRLRRELLEKDIGRNVCQISCADLLQATKKFIDFIESQPFVHIDESDIQYVSEKLVMLNADEEEIDKMSNVLAYLM